MEVIKNDSLPFFFRENHIWLATCFAKTCVSQPSQSEKVCMYMLCEKTYNLHGDAIWTGRLRPFSPSDWRKKHSKVTESEMFTSSKKAWTKMMQLWFMRNNTTFINNAIKHIRMRFFVVGGTFFTQNPVVFFFALRLSGSFHPPHSVASFVKMATFGCGRLGNRDRHPPINKNRHMVLKNDFCFGTQNLTVILLEFLLSKRNCQMNLESCHQ